MRHYLDKIFNPNSIAVVGASEKGQSPGYSFLRHLLDYGYRGKIYPINPRLKNALGLKAYHSLKEISGSVDYVICCIPAVKVKELLEESKDKSVKAIHLFTGRLSEPGREESVELEKEILRKARNYGIRLIGPNCMGIYYPKVGISFNYDFHKESGIVGAIFQRGGASTELIRHASLRGIRFSKVVSYGNAVDLNEADFLDFFLHDPETKIIAVYIEGTRDGKRFFDTLQKTASSKPVLVIKAGSGRAGSVAASSHTASLAGSIRIWKTAISQAGAINVNSLEEMIDFIVAFYFLRPFHGKHKRVGIAGGGGGKSVLSADMWEETGFEVVPLPAEIRDEIKNKAPEIWDWVGNPADRSIMWEPTFDTGEMLKMMERSPYFDFLVANITDDSPFDKKSWKEVIKKEVDDIIGIKERGLKPLVVVLRDRALIIADFGNWRWKFLAKQQHRLINAKIPVFSTAERAVKAINALIGHQTYKPRSLHPNQYPSGQSL